MCIRDRRVRFNRLAGPQLDRRFDDASFSDHTHIAYYRLFIDAHRRFKLYFCPNHTGTQLCKRTDMRAATHNALFDIGAPADVRTAFQHAVFADNRALSDPYAVADIERRMQLYICLFYTSRCV